MTIYYDDGMIKIRSMVWKNDCRDYREANPCQIYVMSLN